MIEILRNEIRYEGFTLKLCQNIPPSFDCGKKDLNDFFMVDLLHYEEQLLAKTYVLTLLGGKEELPKALISFCNDSIRAESFDNR